MITNVEKKLDALIDALGFDVEETTVVNGVTMSVRDATIIDVYCKAPENINYKLTKRKTLTDIAEELASINDKIDSMPFAADKVIRKEFDGAMGDWLSSMDELKRVWALKEGDES